MKPSIRASVVVSALCALATGTIGCQTYEAGQSLPSAYHMFDDVQYFPKGPEFPLANELNAMKQAEEERLDHP